MIPEKSGCGIPIYPPVTRNPTEPFNRPPRKIGRLNEYKVRQAKEYDFQLQ